ncbi:alanine racemase [Alterinioella nitratireducens]|uniref:alanine racemase n=1 Tax=Alterinioella nitratireducens TaxID=2735915 RepID=UPI001553A861|nr:alanine racemase [Alterinioella nitratireducens]NPD19230.1 alanine racemase [Alterinioella nitratireducens]
MATGQLHIDLDAIAANWAALDAMTAVETAAVVKADGYGLGVGPVARRLAQAGARRFFVAIAEEGVALREALGPGPEINVFSGHMEGDSGLIHEAGLIPMLNSPEQAARHRAALPDAPYGVQLDSGMNRLGMEPADWAATRGTLEAGPLTLVMSHLASADDPSSAQNADQLRVFREMTGGTTALRSLAATGGVLLGPDYHFDLCRPGIGLYGGAPFTDATPVTRLSLPVIQTRHLRPGEAVGYSATWRADAAARIATLAAGYADGILRAISGRAQVFAGDIACPLAGRVSMDLIGADITHLAICPDHLDLICPAQGIDDLARAAGSIGYEILTALGARYTRHYTGAAP